MRHRVRWLWVVLVATTAACDSGPSGPGSLEVFVTGEGIGGALLQVDGAGVRGFEALGDTRIYSSPDARLPTRHRVVVITPGSGEMRFSMTVDDVDMETPQVTVLQATRADNRPVTPSAVTVRTTR